MTDPNSTSPDILSDIPGKDILRPDSGMAKFVVTSIHAVFIFVIGS
jgi:hypothetical protein